MNEPAEGLAAERTALAWVRTVLAVLAVSVATARVVADDLPVPALVLTSAAIVVSGFALHYSHGRYRRRGGPSADGRPAATLTGLVMLLGLVGIALIAG